MFIQSYLILKFEITIYNKLFKNKVPRTKNKPPANFTVNNKMGDRKNKISLALTAKWSRMEKGVKMELYIITRIMNLPAFTDPSPYVVQ